MQKAISLGIAFVFILISCEEEVQQLGEKDKNTVTTRFYNATLTRKDSGYVKVILRTPIVEMYEFVDSPFTQFPKGLNLNFYKLKEKKPGYLRASWAKITEQKGLYEGKGNVVVINPDGDTLRSQQLYWDTFKQKIYTKDTTYIIRKDSTKIIASNGLEASDDFKTYILKKNKGSIFVED